MVAVVIPPFIRAALASSVLACAFSSSAFAETICVNLSGSECAAPLEHELQPALTRAAGHVGVDTVELGPGEYAAGSKAGFSYVSGEGIDVQGSGIGRTILRSAVESPLNVLNISVPAGRATSQTAVSDISVLGGNLSPGGAAGMIAGNIESSEFTALSTEGPVHALSVAEGSSVDHVQASAFGPQAAAILTHGQAVVSDSLVHGTVGITAGPGEDPALRRSSAHGSPAPKRASTSATRPVSPKTMRSRSRGEQASPLRASRGAVPATRSSRVAT